MGGRQGVTQAMLGIYQNMQASPFGDIFGMGWATGTSSGRIDENIFGASNVMMNMDNWTRYLATDQEDVWKNKTLEQVSLNYVQLAEDLWKKSYFDTYA